MILNEEHLYHIYNQGNNRQQIFFSHENYLFFLRKMSFHLLQQSDILAWCLMPNHFHIMLYVKRLAEPISGQTSNPSKKIVTLNENIGILLRSYTRAINLQENRSGSLFRKETKAICLSDCSAITPSYKHVEMFGTVINTESNDVCYPQICFNYIHSNPVEANLVLQEEDWIYSSYRDFIGLRSGTLINVSST